MALKRSEVKVSSSESSCVVDAQRVVTNVPPSSVLHVRLMLHRPMVRQGQRGREKSRLRLFKCLIHPLQRLFWPAILLLMQAAISCVKNPTSKSHQSLERFGDARTRQVLQGPVPVIIIIGAECIIASHQFVVELSGDAHSYVMLGGQPSCRLCFAGKLVEA